MMAMARPRQVCMSLRKAMSMKQMTASSINASRPVCYQTFLNTVRRREDSLELRSSANVRKEAVNNDC